jgi:argininosuccinate lyase
MSKKARTGRFEGEVDARARAFSASVDVDRRLAGEDVRGSIAHARMLADRGIIPRDDADAIVAGLERLHGEIRDGHFTWDPAREDVHMNIEAALTERIGAAGGRLHTARSRNDQVATDMRMWTRGACARTQAGIDALLSVHRTAHESVAARLWRLGGERFRPRTRGDRERTRLRGRHDQLARRRRGP